MLPSIVFAQSFVNGISRTKLIHPRKICMSMKPLIDKPTDCSAQVRSQDLNICAHRQPSTRVLLSSLPVPRGWESTGLFWTKRRELTASPARSIRLPGSESGKSCFQMDVVPSSFQLSCKFLLGTSPQRRYRRTARTNC